MSEAGDKAAAFHIMMVGMVGLFISIPLLMVFFELDWVYEKVSLREEWVTKEVIVIVDIVLLLLLVGFCWYEIRSAIDDPESMADFYDDY